MDKVLFVIDMQNDFVTGPLGTDEAVMATAEIKKRVDQYLEEREWIYFTRDTHEENYLETLEGQMLPVEHCIKGTEGWNLIPIMQAYVNIYEGAKVFDKRTFGYEGWKEELGEAVDYEFELCGVCTDICVVSNALMLRMLYPNHKITVYADCCAGTTPEKHEEALEIMRSCQIEVL